MNDTHHLLDRFRTLDLHTQINKSVALAVQADEHLDVTPGALPGDPIGLRGVPIVGVPRGCGGAIRGTTPGTGWIDKWTGK